MYDYGSYGTTGSKPVFAVSGCLPNIKGERERGTEGEEERWDRRDEEIDKEIVWGEKWREGKRETQERVRRCVETDTGVHGVKKFICRKRERFLTKLMTLNTIINKVSGIVIIYGYS